MPYIYMLLSVVIWSLFPLVGAVGVQQLSIFDYILWSYVVGFIISGLCYLAAPQRYKESLPHLEKLEPRVWGEMAFAWLAAIISFACLLKSFSLISKAGAAVVFEVWLIIAIYILPVMLKKSWGSISRRDRVFSLLALAGVAFLLIPEAKTLTAPLPYLFLPLLGGIFMAIASVIKPKVAPRLENKSAPLISLFRIQALFSGGVAVLCLPFALLFPDKVSVFNAQSLFAIIFTGVVIHTLGNILYTIGMLRAPKGNVVVLWCLKPIFVVLWLWLAGQAAVTPTIILGGLFIITASMMVTIKADRTLTYAATIIGILLCGVYVYFVNGFAMNEYYQAISVPLFFYAILVAFMMDRLIKSDELEEQLAIQIINRIHAQAARLGDTASKWIQHILGMVTTNSMSEVNAHYRAVRNAKNKELEEIHDPLDQLALSKVRGTNFSEMFVVFIVGLLTIVSAVAFRPADLIADAFAIVIPLAVIFVFFTVLDLSNNRRTFFLERDRSGEMTLSAGVTKSLRSERIIAALLILLILSAFVGLLVAKHIGVAVPK